MSAQLTLLERPRFCPAVHCHVPCGAGIAGLTCTCKPCRCQGCRQRTMRARYRRLSSFELQMRAVAARPYQPRLFASSHREGATQ